MSSRNSLRIFDLPLNRFSKGALPQFLQQLDKHHDNILKFKADEQWGRIQGEVLQGRRVVVQLQAALAEMDQVGEQLGPEDRREFAERINPYRIQASRAVEKFIKISKSTTQLHVSPSHPEIETQSSETRLLQQEQLLPEEVDVEQRRAQLETFENLQHDISDLNELFSEFAHQVHEQGSMVNEVEQHVETAAENVTHGERNLARAAKYKATLYPLTGAILGTCIGGPVGLLAGLKIGGLAALGGTFLGFAGGKGLKHWHEKTADDEPSALIKSQSTPGNLQDGAESSALPRSMTFSVTPNDRPGL